MKTQILGLSINTSNDSKNNTQSLEIQVGKKAAKGMMEITKGKSTSVKVGISSEIKKENVKTTTSFGLQFN